MAHHSVQLPRDSVSRQIADWRAKRPDLDVIPLEIVARLARVRRHLDAALEEVFHRYGLSAPGFAVLVTLLRLNEPAGVQQRQLMEELALTPGTISVRIDRLEAQGLVKRHPDRNDKRSIFIRITARGRALFERVVPEHLANERRLIAALAPAEQARLGELLSKLLIEFEGTIQDDRTPSLGLILASSHATREHCTEAGIALESGLLVRDVRGAACQAGVRAGDILMAVSGRHIRGIADVYSVLSGTKQRKSVRLRLWRAKRTVQVTLELPATYRLTPGAARTRGRIACFEHLL